MYSKVPNQRDFFYYESERFCILFLLLFLDSIRTGFNVKIQYQNTSIPVQQAGIFYLQNMTKRIVIQGGYGAFHEIAAFSYFENEDIEIVPRNTFKDLFRALKQGQVDFGITAIENSLAGSILPNYSLLLESKMKIIGEIYLRIKQNLVALPGETIQSIKEVFSHPMAILQCHKFFEEYPEELYVRIEALN